ncbi:MAG: lipoprotein signal peptidase [Flavobacteriales bacterium]
MKRPLVIIPLVLFVDQAFKFWIKTHMYIGQEYHILGDWFIIHFTENNGMAFGMELAGDYGKLFLSIFRLVAVAAIAWYLFKIVKEKASAGLVTSISLILAGALGNILDSLYYGLIFSDSYHQVATLFPEAGGYAGFLHGKVVDMLYFPLIEGHFPGWFPFWGGEQFIFFRPVFNMADSSITIGVAMILIFQRRFFGKKEEGDKHE